MANVHYTPSHPFMGKVVLNGVTKTVASFNLENSDATTFNHDGTQHEILLIDRSGSMSRDIDSLIEDVKKVIREVDKDDYITIIWFSGEGEYRTVVKCCKNDADNICKILDTLKSTVGCTCFSDPILEVGTIIDETSVVSDVINVTIFTDGEPVTSWGNQEEWVRIFKNMDAIKNKIVAFNTIGYGDYYNRELLTSMSNITEYGIMTHASKITDYSKIVSHNRERVSDLIGKRVKIVSDGCTVITQSKTGSKMFRDKGVIRLTKQLNAVHLIFDEDVDTVSYIIDDQAYTAKIKSKYSMTTLDDIMYHYAYQLMYNNMRNEAIHVMNFIGNKKLLDDAMSSFTASEVGEFINNLKGYAFKTSKRPNSKIARNSYIPNDDDVCVLDILEFLVAHHAMYYPNKNYKRIGKKVVDQYDLFTPDQSSPSNSMSNLVFNKDKLNVSIQFTMNGFVKLNPIQSGRVGLPSTVSAKVFRNHTIIKDGSLNMKTIKVQVKFDPCTTLTKREIAILEAIEKFKVDPDGIYVIDLSKFKMVRNSTDMSLDDLYNNELAALDCEVNLKVLNYLTQDATDNLAHGSSTHYEFTPEQWSVLNDHGINKSMTYNAISPKTEAGVDHYVAREIRTYFKGLSSLPSVAKVLEKVSINKSLTPSEAKIYNAYQGYQSIRTSTDSLIKHKEFIKKNLACLRMTISSAKFIRTATGNPWFSDNTDTHTYRGDGPLDLVVNYSRVVVDI